MQATPAATVAHSGAWHGAADTDPVLADEDVKGERGRVRSSFCCCQKIMFLIFLLTCSKHFSARPHLRPGRDDRRHHALLLAELGAHLRQVRHVALPVFPPQFCAGSARVFNVDWFVCQLCQL